MYTSRTTCVTSFQDVFRKPPIYFRFECREISEVQVTSIFQTSGPPRIEPTTIQNRALHSCQRKSFTQSQGGPRLGGSTLPIAISLKNRLTGTIQI